MAFMNISELSPMYCRQKSFYGKAKVAYCACGIMLYSYDTPIMCINRSHPQEHMVTRYWSDWSATTGRHINEFARQYLDRPMGKADFFRLPLALEE